MDISKEKYLIGMSDLLGDREIENTPEAVAEFICTAGRNESVIVATPDYITVLDTFGIYISRCNDQDFLQRLLPVIIPKQYEVENEPGQHCDDDESEDQGITMT